MSAVVGREPELGAVEQLLSDGRSGFSVLLLEGEAGIGKTTVWQEAVKRAEDSGARVLACRPAQAEATLGYASLADLLRSLGNDELAHLPDPQRSAIDVALLRTRGRASADARATATAVLSVLSSVAREPVVVAIDDAQWLDASSAAALSFAVRRIPPDARLALLVAVRLEDGDAATPLGLADLSAPAQRVRLSPLSLSAIYHVVRANLGLTLARPLLLRIEEASGGNPLFALELARALEESGGRPGPGEPLPVPESLSGLLRRRVEQLPEQTRDALLAAALLSAPTTTLIQRALGGGAASALQAASRAGVLEIRGDDVRFDHPLLGSAVSSSALDDEQRSMHRRLAEVVDAPEQRAKHLALGTEPPADEVASTLEHAAGRADARGATQEAAELLELACRFTPVDDPTGRSRRTLELARATWRAGEGAETIRLLDALLETDVEGPMRAQALELRAQTHWVTGTTEEAEACCAEALLHVGDDDRTRARVLVTRARISLNAELLHERARAALDVLEAMDDPDPDVHSEALVALTGAEYYLGRGIPWDVVERALELERIAPPRNVGDRMSAALGTWLKYDGDFDGARRWLEQTRRAAVDEGDESSLPYALSHLPQLELWTGNWVAAEALALEHLDLAERTGQELERLTAIYNLAFIEAHMGRDAAARARLEPALAEAASGEPWNSYLLLSALGFLELSSGKVEEAVSALGRAYEIYESTGAGDTPSVFENYPEALVAIGDLKTAESVIELFETRARTARKAVALAPALRCRSLLLGAQQRLDEAVASLEEALGEHGRVDLPFSLARSQLVHGQILRRRGERRAARAALERAIATFDELGSPPWAAKARAELDRVPGRRQSGDALTATEARVAELVAQGKTNDEVAQELFVSKKTVEANLTRIYRKLGIRSRFALASRMHEPDTRDEATKV